MQILFPEPVFRQLRALSEEEDRPVSELVRRAVDRMLQQTSVRKDHPRPKIPTFAGGEILVGADKLKAAIYDDA